MKSKAAQNRKNKAGVPRGTLAFLMFRIVTFGEAVLKHIKNRMSCLASTAFGSVSLFNEGKTETEAAEVISSNDELKLWYDEPATADFYEIFSSKYSFIEWYQDSLGNWLSKGDGWLEFGRSDKQNYTDNTDHSKSSKAPDGTWDVTDAVKQGGARKDGETDRET